MVAQRIRFRTVKDPRLGPFDIDLALVVSAQCTFGVSGLSMVPRVVSCRRLLYDAVDFSPSSQNVGFRSSRHTSKP